MLVANLKKIINERQLWQAKEKILIAVSTGVDSMVLLHVLESLQESGLVIGVAHVNHQLRAASIEEEAFLASYCAARSLPFHCRKWSTPATTNIEAQARDFRYNFFKEIMQQFGYTVLVTAHHGEDQLETMLMKMVRTGEVFASQGIAWTQTFASGRLVRPLLTQSKADLLHYAQENDLVYYEDETNQTLDYQRNRLRHQVLPVLKNENQQVLAHFQQLSEQIQLLETWVKEEQKQWLATAMETTARGITVDLRQYPWNASSKQPWFIAAIVQTAYCQFGLTISRKQSEQLQRLLASDNPQWYIDLASGWQWIRSYETLSLQKKQAAMPEQRTYELVLGEGCELSDKAWVGIFLPGKIKIPKKVKDWSEFRQELLLDSTTGLTIGGRKPGEKIRLNARLTKKIARYFIDCKIPTEEREQSWVLRDKNQKVLALLPYMLSHLSIRKETDKIHYVLLFKYRK
ncbi:tRNA lysidine(34) synthetase TilS [Enterococcus sp. LJL98]